MAMLEKLFSKNRPQKLIPEKRTATGDPGGGLSEVCVL